jgi:hypothetical protein
MAIRMITVAQYIEKLRNLDQSLPCVVPKEDASNASDKGIAWFAEGPIPWTLPNGAEVVVLN